MSRSSDTPLDSASEILFREMRERSREMFKHALGECNIPRAFSKKLICDSGSLHVASDIYDLGGFNRTVVISMGKAGHSMAEAFANIVGTGLGGIVACPDLPAAQLFGFRYFAGGHPLPNDDSFRAGDAFLRAVRGTSPETLVVYLISGGASAIAERPISPNISLNDLVKTYEALVHSGAPIAEINSIRKHLSAIKGGRLAKAASAGHQLSILVSDVPEDALDALASGPTMPDSTTVEDCYAVARQYALLPHLPPSVHALFQRKQLQETPKDGDAAFHRSRYVTVLSNETAVHAAVERAVLGGFAVEVDNDCDGWDYREAADHLLRRLRELRRGVSRACLISGGEVTVKVDGPPGTGGRNQQFALYCAQKIAGEKITVLSAGTDGIDGNSPAAGAVVDGSTLARARVRGFDLKTAASQFDGFPLFDATGDAIITGPTGNNVRDLRILLAY
jgi:hydroxypyruvate reductase